MMTFMKFNDEVAWVHVLGSVRRSDGFDNLTGALSMRRTQECPERAKMRKILTCGPVTLAPEEDWASEIADSEPLL